MDIIHWKPKLTGTLCSTQTRVVRAHQAEAIILIRPLSNPVSVCRPIGCALVRCDADELLEVCSSDARTVVSLVSFELRFVRTFDRVLINVPALPTRTVR